MFGIPNLKPEDFNRLAAQEHWDILWNDDNSNVLIEPAELRTREGGNPSKFVKPSGVFRNSFERAYLHLAELKRRESVALSLAEARPLPMTTRTSEIEGLTSAEYTMLEHLLRAGQLIQKLYRMQMGSDQYESQIAAVKSSDHDSYALFDRNHGPWAEAPKTADDPFANALRHFPVQNFGVYPLSAYAPDGKIKEDFSQMLLNAPTTADSNSTDLTDPFTVVVQNDAGEYVAVPYHVHYESEMTGIADELDQAATAIASLENEKAFYAYLKAAALGFRTDNWDDADRAWTAMNMKNSKWTIRIAPDETYWDPLGYKAGFQFWLGRVDPTAAQVTAVLEPHTEELEKIYANGNTLHQTVPAKFTTPDFMKSILTIGQTDYPRIAFKGEQLPNFNPNIPPRSVIVTNLYTDRVSIAEGDDKSRRVLSENLWPLALSTEITESQADLFARIAAGHEMTHSMWPRQKDTALNTDGSQRLNDQGQSMTTQDALGGLNSRVFEEVKGQNGGLLWIDWQKQQGIISEEQAKRLYVTAVLWCLSKIAQGMKDPRTGNLNTYSLVGGIQLNAFITAGAVSWNTENKVEIDFSKMPAAVLALKDKVNQIIITGDAQTAGDMIAQVSRPGLAGYEAIQVTHLMNVYADFTLPSFETKLILDGLPKQSVRAPERRDSERHSKVEASGFDCR